MSEVEAREFFGEHSSEAWFQELCSSMVEAGETTALCVSKSKGVASLQSLAGPPDPKKVFKNAVRETKYTFRYLELQCLAVVNSGSLNGLLLLWHEEGDA